MTRCRPLSKWGKRNLFKRAKTKAKIHYYHHRKHTHTHTLQFTNIYVYGKKSDDIFDFKMANHSGYENNDNDKFTNRSG